MWPQQQVVPVEPKQLPGVAVAVWNDIPDAQTQTEVLTNVSELFFALMQKQTGNVFAKEEQIAEFLAKIFV